MSYNVWFADLEKAIKAMKEKMPAVCVFKSIQGNADGDFVIKTSSSTYIVRHKDFSIWKLEGSWCTGRWVEIK